MIPRQGRWREPASIAERTEAIREVWTRASGAVLVALQIAVALNVAPIPDAATASGFAWEIRVVERDVLLYGATAIALDPAGTPAIAYVNTGVGVRFARGTPTGWQIETVPGSGGAFGMVSLVLGPGGRPHLAFFDAAEGEAKYAAFDGVAWRVLSVARSHFEGYTSIALNASGVPHIAYAEPTGDLRLAHLSGSTWVTEDADAAVVTARYPSLAFDSTDRPRIAYYGNGNLQIAEWIGYRWATDVVDAGSDPRSVSLAVGASGIPVIGYRSEAAEELRLATWNGTAWIWEPVDSDGDVGWDARLVLDTAGDPHLSYYERISGFFRYAVQTGGSWKIYIVDVTPASGWYSSLALGADGTPRFAYFSWAEKAVNYAAGGFGFGIRTWPARSIRTTSAELVGEITSLGAATAVPTAFDWQVVGGNWQRIPGPTLTAPGFLNVTLEGLDPETSYRYRAAAVVNGTDQYGAIVAVTTRALVRPVFPFEWVLVGGVVTAVGVSAVAFWLSRRRKPDGG